MTRLELRIERGASLGVHTVVSGVFGGGRSRGQGPVRAFSGLP